MFLEGFGICIKGKIEMVDGNLFFVIVFNIKVFIVMVIIKLYLEGKFDFDVLVC